MRTVLLGLIAGVMVLAAMPACAKTCYEKAASRPVALTEEARLEPVDKPPQEDDDYVTYYTQADVEMLARLIWAEARGIGSDTERACVAWTVLNRLDSPAFEGETIAEVVTAPGQFYYPDRAPLEEEFLTLAGDVLKRWNDEKNGLDGTGRVLPAGYFWFAGDGRHNYFRDAFRGGERWDYSLESPYET